MEEYSKSLYPFKSKWIQLKRFNIHYIDEGCGPLILFSHAAIGSSFMYREMIKILMRDFRCVAIDYPGFGLTPSSKIYKANIKEQCIIISEIIAALNLKNIYGFGHDTGGPSLMGSFILDHQLFRGLILTDTLVYPSSEFRKVNVMLSIVGSNLFKLFNRKFNILSKLTFNKGVLTRTLHEAELNEYDLIYNDKSKRDQMINVLKSLKEQGDLMLKIRALFDMGLYGKPLLLIYGSDDPVRILGVPERIMKSNDQADFFTIEGESHFPHEGQPWEMASIITSWVKSTERIIESKEFKVDQA